MFVRVCSCLLAQFVFRPAWRFRTSPFHYFCVALVPYFAVGPSTSSLSPPFSYCGPFCSALSTPALHRVEGVSAGSMEAYSGEEGGGGGGDFDWQLLEGALVFLGAAGRCQRCFATLEKVLLFIVAASIW